MKTDIIEIIEREGIETRKVGREYYALCPFHDDKNPSLHINREKGVWLCRSCGEKGNAITFVRRLKGLTYPEALRYLDMEEDAATRLVRRDKRHERAKFNEWCKAEYQWLVEHVRFLKDGMKQATSFAWMEGYGIIDEIKELSRYEYHLDILEFGSDKQRFELYRERNGHIQPR